MAINGLIEEVTGYLLGEEGKERKLSHPRYASILLNAAFPHRKLKYRCGKCADWAGTEEEKGVVQKNKAHTVTHSLLKHALQGKRKEIVQTQ